LAKYFDIKIQISENQYRIGKVEEQGQVQWELATDKVQQSMSFAKMEMERQEEQLSAREQDILDRMWTIQSQANTRRY